MTKLEIRQRILRALNDDENDDGNERERREHPEDAGDDVPPHSSLKYQVDGW